MNYQEMSDHEINTCIAESMGFSVTLIHHDDSVTFRDSAGKIRGRKNYCNSWADAGPIIQENRISLFASDDDGKWMAKFINYKNVHMDKNPLRASMIVFLMMKGGE